MAKKKKEFQFLTAKMLVGALSLFVIALSSSIAATYAMLEATDRGLGSVWVMNFEAAKLSEAFGLPANIRPICLLPLGKAAPGAEPGPNHALRVPLSEILLKREGR